MNSFSKPLMHWQYYPWLLWVLGGGFFFAEYFAHVSLGVMVPQLMASFKIGALGLGAMSAYFWYAYTAMQVPVGALVDRYGAYCLLTSGALLCGIACILFGCVETLWAAKFFRFLIGFTASFAFVSTLKLCKIWFPSNRFGLLAGLTQAIGMLGAVVGEAPIALVVDKWGWRMTMYLIGGVIFLLGIAIALLVHDHPEDSKTGSKEVTSETSNVWVGFLRVLQTPQVWLNGLYVGLMYMPTSAFGELWGVNYCVATFHISKQMAAVAIGFIFLGWAIGGPVIGAFSDGLAKRKPILIVSAITSCLTLSLALYLPYYSLWLLCALFFAYGIANTGVGVSYALSGEITPLSTAGLSIAFANMASVLIGAFFQPFLGFLLELQWNHIMVHSIPIYTARAYQLSMLVLPIGCLVSSIVAFFIKETHCKAYHQIHRE